MRLKSLVIIVSIFSSLFYAQNLTQEKIIIKSPKHEIKSLLKFNDLYDYKSPLHSLDKKFYYNTFEYSSFNIISDQENKIPLSSLTMFNVKRDMKNTFSIYRQGQNKYDLGIVGQILGYAGSAAALGLAIRHVTKYKSHYGFKKKK